MAHEKRSVSSPACLVFTLPTGAVGRSEGSLPLCHLRGTNTKQKMSKLMPTSEERKSVDKANTGHFQQATMNRHLKYSELGIYC